MAFCAVLVFWLAVIFACFGLNAPRNAFVFIMIVLSPVSIASALLVILEVDTPVQRLGHGLQRPDAQRPFRSCPP
ncbi:MAG: hypothetical protein M0002_11375 [Rhodospirillales bacterium]|nr:hypothetical protein [Rhodospirillales bacterium]